MEDCVGHGRQRPAVRELRDLEHVDAPPDCENGGDAFALGFIEAPLKVVKVKAKLFLMWGDNPVPGVVEVRLAKGCTYMMSGILWELGRTGKVGDTVGVLQRLVPNPLDRAHHLHHH